MNALDYFNKIVDISKQLAKKKRQMESITLIQALRYDRQPGGTSGNKSNNSIYKLIELKEEIALISDTLEEAKREAESKIMLLDDGEEIEVLELRYIEMLEWEKIADRLGYTVRNCYYIRDSALKNLNEIIS